MSGRLYRNYDDWKLDSGIEDRSEGPTCQACGYEITDDSFCEYYANYYHRGCLHHELMLEHEKEINKELDDHAIEMEKYLDRQKEGGYTD